MPGIERELLFVELRDRVRPGGECLRRRPIGPDLEGVVAPDFEEVRDFAQYL